MSEPRHDLCRCRKHHQSRHCNQHPNRRDPRALLTPQYDFSQFKKKSVGGPKGGDNRRSKGGGKGDVEKEDPIAALAAAHWKEDELAATFDAAIVEAVYADELLGKGFAQARVAQLEFSHYLEKYAFARLPTIASCCFLSKAPP